MGQGSSQTSFSGEPRRLLATVKGTPHSLKNSRVSLSYRQSSITNDPKTPVSPALQLLEAFPRTVSPTDQSKSQPQTSQQFTSPPSLSPQL